MCLFFTSVEVKCACFPPVFKLNVPVVHQCVSKMCLFFTSVQVKCVCFSPVCKWNVCAVDSVSSWMTSARCSTSPTTRRARATPHRMRRMATWNTSTFLFSWWKGIHHTRDSYINFFGRRRLYHGLPVLMGCVVRRKGSHQTDKTSSDEEDCTCTSFHGSAYGLCGTCNEMCPTRQVKDKTT